MNEREFKQFTKVNILGTNYEIIFKSEEEEIRLKTNWGITDYHTKEIYINDNIEKETDDSCKNLFDFKNKVLRHEILHAFLYESGLRENSFGSSSWAENEEMIDWFSIQFPKILKVYKELNII